MELNGLKIYKVAREINRLAWQIYNKLDWQDKKIIGDQFISAVDSIGVNIAEGFGRFHYLDKNKFNYNARASLYESFYWLELLQERNKINKEEESLLKEKFKELQPQLNSYINSTKNLSRST